MANQYNINLLLKENQNLLNQIENAEYEDVLKTLRKSRDKEYKRYYNLSKSASKKGKSYLGNKLREESREAKENYKYIDGFINAVKKKQKGNNRVRLIQRTFNYNIRQTKTQAKLENIKFIGSRREYYNMDKFLENALFNNDVFGGINKGNIDELNRITQHYYGYYLEDLIKEEIGPYSKTNPYDSETVSKALTNLANEFKAELNYKYTPADYEYEEIINLINAIM